jgi:hypothetical protein
VAGSGNNRSAIHYDYDYILVFGSRNYNNEAKLELATLGKTLECVLLNSLQDFLRQYILFIFYVKRYVQYQPVLYIPVLIATFSVGDLHWSRDVFNYFI